MDTRAENRSRAVRRWAICGCLAECSPEEFPAWLQHPEVDLVEWRMDMFAGKVLCRSDGMLFSTALSDRPRLPVIATNRPLREMGAFPARRTSGCKCSKMRQNPAPNG